MCTSEPRPWYLTLVRVQGLVFRPTEKSRRPLATVTVSDGQTYEVLLGSDGQNPNLKSPFIMHGIENHMSLDLNVWHVLQGKRRKNRRQLVGSARISLAEILKRQRFSGDGVDIHLNCVPPQKGSPTVVAKQQRRAVMNIRIIAPSSRPSTSSSYTAVASASTSVSEDDDPATPSISRTSTLNEAEDEEDTQNWSEKPEPTRTPKESRLIRRRQPRRGYDLSPDSSDTGLTSSGEHSPTTPKDEYFLPWKEDEDCSSPNGGLTIVESAVEDSWAWLSQPILPQHAADAISIQNSISFAVWCLDLLSPYCEMKEACSEEDYDKILGRLLTEWYVVGASLLALAGIDAAVFGFSSGTLFAIEDSVKSLVSFGAITAGLGIVFDAWFLLIFSGASPARFQRLSTDVYNTHIFFCLTCRLPAICMFLSTVALMLFLLSVAWSSMSTAVLVISCLAGVIFSLQYLIFGCHRLVNSLVWLIRTGWRRIRTHSNPAAPPPVTAGGK